LPKARQRRAFALVQREKLDGKLAKPKGQAGTRVALFVSFQSLFYHRIFSSGGCFSSCFSSQATAGAEKPPQPLSELAIDVNQQMVDPSPLQCLLD
jgi:hypothetical protein